MPQTTLERTRQQVAYGVLYSFKGGSEDGATPEAGLLNVKGTFYGTTSAGGSVGCHRRGCGTVFSIAPSGTESVLHSFTGTSGDGESPLASLININGTLYGTTYDGGQGRDCESSGCGTVFEITTPGTETVLHNFKRGNRGSGDGYYPYAALLNVTGTLYGTTYFGGSEGCYREGCGTVFSITPSGTEGVIYSFKGVSGDGAYPLAGLINVKGTLYGTTLQGGANGGGTVFSITPSGTETVLHSFGSTGDGYYPSAGLLNVAGTLYGTTEYGGASGAGTVFSLSTSGTETVLYSFKGGSGDGERPLAGLVSLNRTLCGTTYEGGANSDGTVFSVTTRGAETVLHSFGGASDGYWPVASLINVKGTLYGTTDAGGARGDGTVFSLKP